MEQSRRLFLGSTAALGSAAVIGGGAFLFTDRGASAQSAGGDLIARELWRQQREALRGLRGPKAGEAARKLASLLRLNAAMAAGDDARITAAIRATIRREGKDHYLLKDLEPAHWASALQEAGLPRNTPRPPIDYAAKAAAIDELARLGPGAVLNRFADDFEKMSGAIEAQAAVVRPAARRMSIDCNALDRQLAASSAFAAICCGIAPATPICYSALSVLAGTLAVFGAFCL